MKEICKGVFYAGVDDKKIDLFEGMYKVPYGVSYNSYVIKDEKIAVVDSVDAAFGEEWLAKVEAILNGAQPDYLIVQHMEPDHSACVAEFTEKYPMTKIVGNQKTFVMLEEYFGEDFTKNRLVVADGDKLNLGKHELKFVFAPMVHWPEVMVTYDATAKLLFSADAFGRFGASDLPQEFYESEARRYYIGIVGKYGVQVRAALNKLSAYEIQAIAPLHGNVIEGEQLSEMLRLYTLWSGYQPETEKGVLIAYASVYGHTKKAAYMLAEELESNGEPVTVLDLARDDWAECVAQAFRYKKLVIAATTYNADIFPAAREFIDRLAERNYQNRTVAFIENGTWAPVCARLMQKKLEGCKNLTFAQTTVKIRSAVNKESAAQINALAEELTKL
ncbi:MAG: MBL fold metallo-hydrolase [Clostridia bacterium]|nr:MBL fold metallo-hydrolase [Clostridia bacterium]